MRPARLTVAWKQIRRLQYRVASLRNCLEPIEAAYRCGYGLLERPIMLALLFSADSGRDDRDGSEALDGIHDLVGVIASVSHHERGLAACQQG